MVRGRFFMGKSAFAGSSCEPLLDRIYYRRSHFSGVLKILMSSILVTLGTLWIFAFPVLSKETL